MRCPPSLSSKYRASTGQACIVGGGKSLRPCFGFNTCAKNRTLIHHPRQSVLQGLAPVTEGLGDHRREASRVDDGEGRSDIRRQSNEGGIHLGGRSEGART